jgi:hypothetical protein
MSVRNVLNVVLVGALVAYAMGTEVAAQSNSLSSVTSASAKPVEGASGYNQPPKDILGVMHAPSPPVPDVSPTRLFGRAHLGS